MTKSNTALSRRFETGFFNKKGPVSYLVVVGTLDVRYGHIMVTVLLSLAACLPNPYAQRPMHLHN